MLPLWWVLLHHVLPLTLFRVVTNECNKSDSVVCACATCLFHLPDMALYSSLELQISLLCYTTVHYIVHVLHCGQIAALVV